MTLRLAAMVMLFVIAETADGQVPTLADEPAVAVFYEQGQPMVYFTGSLMSAPSAAGPWSFVQGASSPYVPDLPTGHRFYKARVPLAYSVFYSRTPVFFSIAGPLQTHFDLAYAGLPDGIFPPVRLEEYFEATLSMPDLVLPIRLRVRGNSSLQECPFPKLKFKVGPEHRPGTPFADAREVKIGTHCAEGGYGNIGRLRDQRAVFREVLAYELLSAMDFLAPRIRRAVIEYRDTSDPTSTQAEVGWQLSREAFIVEDIEVLASRLGARLLTDAELADLVSSDFDPQLIVDLQLFMALLGNWDYQLGTGVRGVWNCDVLEFTEPAGKRLSFAAGDFDLASIVTAVVRRNYPVSYHPELGEVERETRYQVERIRSQADVGRFAAAKQRFLAANPALESVVASALIDDEGRRNAVRHLNAFYDALAAQGTR